MPHETTAAATAVQRVDSRRHQPVDAKHAASPSGAYAHEYQDMGVALEDYEVVALYLDAISELSNLVCSGSADRDELKRLSDYVMVMKAVRMWIWVWRGLWDAVMISQVPHAM